MRYYKANLTDYFDSLAELLSSLNNFIVLIFLLSIPSTLPFLLLLTHFL